MKDFESLNVLVVEDDVVTQFLTQKTLSEAKIAHSLVDRGEKAIEALKTKKFNCVLMDIVMHGEDGMNTVRWIRDSEDEYFKKLPLFALTSFSSEQHTKGIMESGLNGHLVKPLIIEAFIKHYTEFQGSLKP